MSGYIILGAEGAILRSGASWSFILHYLHPDKLISDGYPCKENRYAIGGLINIWREVRIVTKREQLCIFMKHEDFKYHDLKCVQMQVIVTKEVSEEHLFKDSEEKD